jgi:hypothetical protein
MARPAVRRTCEIEAGIGYELPNQPPPDGKSPLRFCPRERQIGVRPNCLEALR